MENMLIIGWDYKVCLTDKGKNIILKIVEIIDEWTDILVQVNKEEEIKTSIRVFRENFRVWQKI